MHREVKSQAVVEAPQASLPGSWKAKRVEMERAREANTLSQGQRGPSCSLQAAGPPESSPRRGPSSPSGEGLTPIVSSSLAGIGEQKPLVWVPGELPWALRSSKLSGLNLRGRAPRPRLRLARCPKLCARSHSRPPALRSDTRAPKSGRPTSCGSRTAWRPLVPTRGPHCRHLPLPRTRAAPPQPPALRRRAQRLLLPSRAEDRPLHSVP